MPGFLLLDLNQNLFERVITKLPLKNYYRLQQTCREMKMRIRTSKNISISLPNNFLLCKAVTGDLCLLRCVDGIGEEDILIPDLYGTRLGDLVLGNVEENETGPDDEFEWFCKAWKDNQVTCAGIDAASVEHLSLEKCAKLLDILKPVRIVVYHPGPRVYEAILQSESLNKVKLFLEEEDMETALPRLLSKFPDVTVRVVDVFSEEPRFDLLRDVQQLLYRQSFPNLYNFLFKLGWRAGHTLPETVELLKAQLPGCHLIQEEYPFFDPANGEGYLNCTCVDLPQHFPLESSLKITLQDNSFMTSRKGVRRVCAEATIQYQARDDLSQDWMLTFDDYRYEYE